MHVTEKLLEFATEQQAVAIRAYLEHGTMRAAATAMGLNPSSVHKLLSRAIRRAASQGYSPRHDMTKTVPEGFVVKGVSTYYDEEGKPRGQWVKSSADMQKYLDLVREVVDELKQEARPSARVPAPPSISSDLLNLYVLADIHIGALSWEPETGADWDTSIAEQTILDAFSHLIARAPEASRGVFCQLGDALHYDGLSPVTPTSGHIVDADGRYHRIVRAAIRIFRRVILMMLEKYETVTVIMAQGNHDLSGAVWLQEAFSLVFEDNPRCEVIVNPAPYYSLTHGRTFLGFHHGHRAKLARLAEVFTGRAYWSELANCRQAFIHTGHQHHRQVKELDGCVVEMHQTLAARSSYEAHAGYHADRSMTCITYHTAGREHSRALYYPEVPDGKLP